MRFISSLAAGLALAALWGNAGAQETAALAPLATPAPVASAPAAVSAPISASSPALSVAPAPASAPAAASAPEPTWVPEIPQVPVLGVLDEPRDYVSERFVTLVSDIDKFFGTNINYQETNDSVLQVDWTRVMGYTGLHQFVWQGKAKVHLPQTEKSLHLLFESDPDKNTANASSQVQTGASPVNTAPPSSYGAGLRHELKSQDGHWFLGTDGGIKLAGLNSTPFLRARGSYSAALDGWRLKLAETPFWFNTTGVGETTELSFERTISEPKLFRASTSATWLNNRQSFDLRQDLSVFQTVSERTAMLYQASALGTSDARMQSRVTDYVLLMLYRHRLHREWMYLEISPQVHFPWARNFKSSGMLSLRLEILFDKSK